MVKARRCHWGRKEHLGNDEVLLPKLVGEALRSEYPSLVLLYIITCNLQVCSKSGQEVGRERRGIEQ